VIGGTDIIIPAVGDPDTLDACVRVVRRRWPNARFEDAVTGEKYERYGDIPLGRVRELLAYPDSQAEAAWDSGSPDTPPNSMLYLILSEGFVTVVLEDPEAADMQAVLESIRGIQRDRLLSPHLEEKYGEAA
jgi:hypothetical protein